MVLTAKDHHAVFHYVRGRHHLPEPLRVTLKKKLDQQETQVRMPKHETMGAVSNGAVSYVESEKRLKKQLMKLLELQKEERQKYNGRRNPNVNESVLGVPIANRYLGEDLLPFPSNKGEEEEWTKKMEKRKEELRVKDEQDWKEMMIQYEDVMEGIVHDTAANNHNDIDARDNKPKVVPNPPNQQSATWPAPTDKAGPNTTILLHPAFGKHRSTSNAIFVFAEGYDLSIYLAFIGSLSASGYKGDVVISISTKDKLKPGVQDYLTSEISGLNIVGYEVEWDCYKQSGEVATGANEGINHCQMNRVFGDAERNVVKDPREARPVATARYELYWMWSLMYESDSWIMLIDARDAWFQLDPFDSLGGEVGVDGGELHLFGVSNSRVFLFFWILHESALNISALLDLRKMPMLYESEHQHTIANGS
jgi:hypothetical protein